MKMSTECAEAVKKANSILRKLEKKIPSIILPLYKYLVWSHLEYCVQFWLSHFKEDSLDLPNEQNRVTERIRDLEQQGKTIAFGNF